MSSEREVVLGELDPSQAASQLTSGREGGTYLRDIQNSVPQFKRVDDYTTFMVEWDLIGDDLVFHFYLTKEYVEDPAYWTVQFPQVLNVIGQEHFGASAPRLQAKYTEEVQSWWMKAQRYGHILDIPVYVAAFFEKLDAGLEQEVAEAKVRQGPA